jgi:hypothetical protein
MRIQCKDSGCVITIAKGDRIADLILAYIALNGPKRFSDLLSKVPTSSYRGSNKQRAKLGSSGAVHPPLEQLKKSKLIKPLQSGNEETYDLTLSGLLIALSFKPLWSHIDKVIQYHAKKLPLLLGKWDWFVHVEEKLNIRMVRIAKERMQEYLFYPEKTVHASVFSSLIEAYRQREIEVRIRDMLLLSENENFEQLLQEDITRYVHLPWIFALTSEYAVPQMKINVRFPSYIRYTGEMPKKVLEVGDFLGWMGIMYGDENLKRYLINELDRLDKFGNNCSYTARLFLDYMEKNPAALVRDVDLRDSTIS